MAATSGHGCSAGRNALGAAPFSRNVLGAPETLEVTLTTPGTVPGSSRARLVYAIRSLVDASLSAAMTLRVSNALGVVLDIPLDAQVEPLQPRLVANPGSLHAPSPLVAMPRAQKPTRKERKRGEVFIEVGRVSETVSPEER